MASTTTNTAARWHSSSRTFGFSAFALLNTRLPNGQTGFSLAASIFGEFNLPLGYGFFLTGLGGVIGVNRTVDTTRCAMCCSTAGSTTCLFPADPIANAATILEDMAAILPPMAGPAPHRPGGAHRAGASRS